MQPRPPLFAILALTLLAAPLAKAAPQDRISEIVPTALEAWEREGFRVQLRLGFESLEPEGLQRRLSSDGLDHFSLAVEPGVRLSRWWSLSTSLRYTVLADQLGLRWTTSADATFHPFHGFHLAAGIGYGGMLGDLCTGSGVALLARAGWLIPMGEIFAMGPVLQTDWQNTDCEGQWGNNVLRHRSMNFSWSLAWR